MTTNKTINDYLKIMVEREASDLFLQVSEPAVLRIHGKLVRLDEPASTEQQMQQYFDQLLTPLARKKFEQSPDLDIAHLVPDVGRFRVNLFLAQGQLALVARAIPLGAVRFSSLNLSPTILDFANKPSGLVLIAGPTGCGKSTTLASLIHQINASRADHIVTIEDPIEFVHEPIKSLIHQRQVGFDTESFATALKHVVRQNPDTILIGEMRDRDTIETALSAALTGHLIFTTLHTTNVAQSIDRMLNYFPPEARTQAQADLAVTLVGIVAMRLLPRKNGKGRIPACEILKSSPTVRRCLAEGNFVELYDVMKRSEDEGMQTMNQALYKLISADMIDEKVALAISGNPEELKLNMQGMFTGIDSIDLRTEVDDEEEEKKY